MIYTHVYIHEYNTNMLIYNIQIIQNTNIQYNYINILNFIIIQYIREYNIQFIY